jgi:hypothetical protein
MIIAGIEVEMTAFQEREPEVRGEAVRSWENDLMDGTDAGKRVWEGTTYIMTPAAVAALRLAVAGGPVVCSGVELLGESVLATVKIGAVPRGPAYDENGRPDWTGVSLTLPLTVREA